MYIKLKNNDLQLIKTAGEVLKDNHLEFSDKLLSLPLDSTSPELFSNVSIDLYRDAAIELENIDIKLAFNLIYNIIWM